jgi:hypothetical protein
VKILIKVLKIDSKNESKETEPANDKFIKNIDKAREIEKALAKVCYD